MLANKKRSQSLNNNINHSKRNWLQFIFGGLSSSAKFRKRGKSEKSVYSQTEIFNLRAQNETATQYSLTFSDKITSPINKNTNSDSKASKSIISNSELSEIDNFNGIAQKSNLVKNRIIRHVLLNFPEVLEALESLINYIIDDCCYESIKKLTSITRSQILLQRLKFKHELSKLYYKIYIDDKNDLKIDNFYKNPFKNVKQCKNLEKMVLSNEKEIKNLCCTTRHHFPRRYTIKKRPNVKNRIIDDIKSRFSEDFYKSIKIDNLEYENEKSCSEEFDTMSCAVSISSLDIPNEHVFESCDKISVKFDKKCDGDNSKRQENVFYIDSSDDLNKINLNPISRKIYPRGDQNECNTIKNNRITETPKSIILDKKYGENNKLSPALVKSQQRESSIVIDFEVFDRSEKTPKESPHSDHTFSDIKTFSTHEECSQLKAPVLISIAWSNGQNTTPNYNVSNSRTRVNPSSNPSMFGINIIKETNYHDPSNTGCGFIERFCETEKTVSTKYSRLPEQCVTLSETLTHPFGTLCEVLSENYSSNATELSFQRRNSMKFEKSKTKKDIKSNPTFWKHTIASKLKMKR